MFESMSDTITLRSGVRVPVMGLGTYKSNDSVLDAAVACAVRCGYRHIDTATYYGNEESVGRAVKHSGISRDDLVLAAKLWPSDFRCAEDTFSNTLKNLRTDYIDLYMMHWPGTDISLMYRTYEKLLGLKDKGLIRALGASNFLEYHLDLINKEFGKYPEFDQIEIHPWQQQKELREFCRDHDIAVTAWGPLMHSHLSEEPAFQPLAAKYDATPAQIVLKWHMQLGNIVIPKSINPVRIIENSDIFWFTISDEDMDFISGLDRKKGFGSDPMTYNGE